MKRFSSRQRDDAFGQSMLALRTSLGLTQGELAHRLGVSGRAVRQWEGGLSYPKAEHLQHLMTLAVRASAFPPGRRSEEHTSELQSQSNLVCRLLLEKKTKAAHKAV